MSRWTSPRAWAASSAPATCVDDARSPVEGLAALPREQLLQVRPVYVAHREVEPARDFARVVDRDDVRGGRAMPLAATRSESARERLVLGQPGERSFSATERSRARSWAR